MSDSRIDWWPPMDGAPPSPDPLGGGDGHVPQQEPPRRSRSRDRQHAARMKSQHRRSRIVAIVVIIGLAIYQASPVENDEREPGPQQDQSEE